MKGYEKLEQHLIHQGKVVGFYEDIVKLPSGKVVDMDLVKLKGSSCCSCYRQRNDLTCKTIP